MVVVACSLTVRDILCFILTAYDQVVTSNSVSITFTFNVTEAGLPPWEDNLYASSFVIHIVIGRREKLNCTNLAHFRCTYQAFGKFPKISFAHCTVKRESL